MKHQEVDAVILGAGLTGLSTAHFLSKQGKRVVVLERENRVGGSIQTHTSGEYTFESGPNSGALSNAETVELFDDLAGLCTIELAKKESKRRLILKDGSWHALPSGLQDAVSTPLFTLKDKFRILGEPFRAKGKDDNENIEQFVKRRLGVSFYEYAVDPFISGIYAGDPSMLKIKYALPKLYALEQNYGSFIRGAVKKAKQAKSELEKRATKEIFSVQGGLSNLVQAMVESVGKEAILLDQKDFIIAKKKNGYVTKTSQADIHSTFVVSTIPPDYLRYNMPFIDKYSYEKICDFDYAPVVQVAVGFKEWNGVDINAFGGLIPSKEKQGLLGILFMSSIFKNRAPEDGVLFSVFMGGMRNKSVMSFPDKEIRSIIEKHFKNLMECYKFNPQIFKIFRHQKAIPQYDERSKKRFELIDALEKEHKGLFVRGNIIDGIGIPDRIKQGKNIADKIVGVQ